MLCTDTENLAKISEKYSVFAEAASILAAAFHEEKIANSIQSNGSGSGSASTFGRENAYSLNYESDDDLGGVDAAPPIGQQVRETQPIIQNRITVDQLQQAIQAATQVARSSEAVPSTDRRPSSQQQMEQSSSNQSSFSSSLNQGSTTAQTQNQRQSTRDWTQQLSTMREMGFTDDAISIQALEASDGDVQGAISLYFILNGQSDQ